MIEERRTNGFGVSIAFARRHLIGAFPGTERLHDRGGLTMSNVRIGLRTKHNLPLLFELLLPFACTNQRV